MLVSLALATLVPALVAALGALAAGALGRRGGAAAWGAPVAVALGYGAGQVGLLGLPPLVPVEASQWLPHLALAAALLAGAEGIVPHPHRWRWPVRILLLLIAAALLLRPLLAYSWGPAAGAARVVAVVAAAGVVWVVVAGAARAMTTLPFAVLLIACTSALSIASLFAHSASLAQLAGCLAAAVGGGATAALLLHGALPFAPVAAVAAPLLVALAATAHFYTDLPLVAALFIAAAPAVAWVAARRAGGPWVGVATAMLLAAAGVAMAAHGT